MEFKRKAYAEFDEGEEAVVIKKTKLNEDGDDEHYGEDEGEEGDSNLNEELEIPQFTLEDLLKLLKNFERHFEKNQELRAKFPKSADKWMDSEVDLDEDITKLHILTTEIPLWDKFIQSGVVPKLITLISHENIDLGIEVINFLRDLYDVEVDIGSEEEDAKIKLVKEFQDNKLLESLVNNLARLNEEKDDESEAVHKSLNIIENSIDLDPECAKYLADNTQLLVWLLKSLSPKGEFHDNQLYSSEILANLLLHKENQFTFGKVGGIEQVLTSLADYRKKDPKSEEEREMIENLFDVVCSSLLLHENQIIFFKTEGVELMIRMLKEKNFCSRPALKVLSYAIDRDVTNCKIFVDGLGLKYMFPIFMRKALHEKKQENLIQIDENIIAIICSLLMNTTGVQFDRVINKFKESENEKVDRIIECYNTYLKKIKTIEKLLSAPREDESDAEDINESLTKDKYAALFILHKIAYIIGVLVTIEDQDLIPVIKKKLELHDIERDHLKEILTQYEEQMDESKEFKRDRELLRDLAGKL